MGWLRRTTASVMEKDKESSEIFKELLNTYQEAKTYKRTVSRVPNEPQITKTELWLCKFKLFCLSFWKKILPVSLLLGIFFWYYKKKKNELRERMKQSFEVCKLIFCYRGNLSYFLTFIFIIKGSTYLWNQ